MIVLDGIIYGLQKHGGITVYFDQVIKAVYELTDDAYVIIPKERSDKVYARTIIEKYSSWRLIRRVQVPHHCTVFHSSYWRRPNKYIKTVVTVHDLIAEKSWVSLKTKIFQYFRYRAICQADVIIAISESTRRDLIDFYPKLAQDKIRVVYNCISSCYLSANLTCPRDKNSFVFVGSRSGYKNFLSAVIALQKFPDSFLYIVGGGNLTRKELRILRSSLGERFKHFLYLSEIELRQIFENCNALLYTSLYEGFGLPVAEAMACGCFVICGNNSSLREVHGGLNFDSGNGTVSEIIEAVFSALKFSDDFQRRIDGADRVGELFSFEVFKKNMKDIYFG